MPSGWNATSPTAAAIDFSRVLRLYKQYVNDTAAVRREGFVSPGDAVWEALGALVGISSGAGTCAQVTIVIKQQMLLTRTAVSAPTPWITPGTPWITRGTP